MLYLKVGTLTDPTTPSSHEKENSSEHQLRKDKMLTCQPVLLPTSKQSWGKAIRAGSLCDVLRRISTLESGCVETDRGTFAGIYMGGTTEIS